MSASRGIHASDRGNPFVGGAVREGGRLRCVCGLSLRSRSVALAIVLGMFGCGSEATTAPAARSTPVKPTAPSAATARDEDGTYMGRPLAETMSHLGADWLTRDNRDEEENTTLMHENLGLGAGDVACDVGAGNGYHTLRMAQAVGPGGRAIGVDLQPEMLERLSARAASQDIRNVQTVLASPTDPKLPPNTCDLILLVDVYHELSDPSAVLQRLRSALTDRGRIALLEYRAEDPKVPIKELHKMSKTQILREYSANGLRLASEFDGLPWQHMMFFVPQDREQVPTAGPP